MRAAVVRRYGPPSVVQIEDVPKPTAESDEILIRVRATTVNRTDAHYREATPFVSRFFTGLVKPRQPIFGTEFAGEVEAIGAAVTKFAVGDRVFGYNEGPFGTHAEYLVVGQDDSVAMIPNRLTYEEVAPSTEGSHYALLNLRKARVGEGSTVLIYGATGAVGSAAVQLAKARGASVTAVCGTAHLDLIAGLGADRVVDYQTSDFTDDTQRYDFVFDAVGKTSFGECRGLLKDGGIFGATELGRFAQNLTYAITTRWFGPHRVIFAFPVHSQKMMERFRDLLEEGSFKPLIDRTYPLEQIVEAYEYVETGQKVGNVVITI